MDFLSIMCPLGGRLVRTVARGRSRSILTDNFHTGLVPSTSPPSDLIARLALIHLYKCTFLVYSWTEICHIWRTGQKIKGTTGYQPIMIVIFVTKKKLRANYATLCCCVVYSTLGSSKGNGNYLSVNATRRSICKHTNDEL